jgi:GT2 family glycosyltransferase
MKKLAVIVPTHSHFEYAARAVRTALEKTSRDVDPHAIVVDDGSPDWLSGKALAQILPDGLFAAGRVTVYNFRDNGGLTRSWNRGLEIARDLGADYACCANSDVVFSQNWDKPLRVLLDGIGGAPSLVGPVTNAPGTEEAQLVRRHLDDYRLSDAQGDVDATGAALYARYGVSFSDATLNGFCLLARTQAWWDNAFDAAAGHVFKPRNDFNSKGQPNPTPLMTLNEYELQRRWHARGLRTGYCPGSFVFHYRAVSRGGQHRRGLWMRMKQA